ncbi:MAG: substrate-binding domain-containing protein [Woeseiaceae bacterium]
MPNLIRISSLLVAIALLSGCGDEQSSSPTTEAKPVVALIVKSLANEFFVTMADSARAHQAANAKDYELIINGLKDESDLRQQVALIEQMTARGADIIVIAPADSKALIPAIKRARERGVVVVNIDNQLDRDLLNEANVQVPFVGPDNRAGARLAADHLAATLAIGDQVGIIGGIATAFNGQQRQLGFEDAMTAAGIEVVSAQAANWEQAKASAVAAAMIAEHPRLRALLCSNDSMAIGAVAAIRQADKQTQIAVIGYDNIDAARALLRDGDMLATVDQYGDQLAIYGIEYGLQILETGLVPADKQTPVRLVTADLL